MPEVIGFGEVMLRLSPPSMRRLEQSTSLDVFIGGSELNTVVAASRLGLSAGFVTGLPDNVLGRMVAGRAQEQGIDVSHCTWRPGGRLGIYFYEYGALPRPAEVVYDRAGSAFSTLVPGEIPWAELLQGSRLFLTSGINVPLSPSLPEVVREALTAAKAAGVQTAFDLNYRSKLWTPAEARRALEPLLELVDLFFIAEGDAQQVLGLEETEPVAAARLLAQRYGFQVVSYIYNPPAGTGRLWDVVAVRGDEVVRPSRSYTIQTIDRLGAGDAFAGGFLYGHLRRDLQAAVEIGNAMLALKNTIAGDLAIVSLDDVEALLAGQIGGVRR